MLMDILTIRSWAVDRSRAHITERFKRLTHARKGAHNRYLTELPYYTIYMQYSGHPPLPPYIITTLQAQISEAHAELKRGIDADWRASIMEYPKVLDYFYGLVEIRLPADGADGLAARRQLAGSTDPPYTPATPNAPRFGRRNRNSREASEPPEPAYERRSKRRDSMSYVVGGGGGGASAHSKRLSTIPMAPMAPPTPSHPPYSPYPGAFF